jgi:thioredoxin-like negative regulator of GroEL
LRAWAFIPFRSIPTLLLFKGGENVGQLVGNVPKSAIDDLIKRSLK